MHSPFSSDTAAVFLAVLEAGSFSAAARRLGRVPSAVSMAMANLEAELALDLFDRSGREPVPTAQALALEPQARLLLSQLQQLNTQALALSQGLETRLTLVIAPELQATPWARSLRQLAREYPQLEVQIITAPQTDALQLLHTGAAQLALVFERPAADGRELFQEVGQETLVAVIARQHPLLATRSPLGGIHDTQVRDTRQILVGSRNEHPLRRDNNFYLVSELYWRVDHPAVALELVVAELGWAWLPRALVQPYINGNLLVELPLDNLTNRTELWIDLVWSRERPLGLGAQRFVALMAAQYREYGNKAPPET